MPNILSRLFSEEKKHYLLQPQVPAYSNRTVKRAFIVWLHCGQVNDFKYVCDYYHRLEAMEEQLSFKDRIESSLHEFNLLTEKPPTSDYIKVNFPNLYRPVNNNVVEASPVNQLNLDDCIFDIQDFYKLKVDKSMRQKDMLKMSRMIRGYCDSHSKTLLYVLQQFDQFLKKCELDNTAINMSMFIMKQHLKDELVNYNNMPKDFSFLDISYVPDDEETDNDTADNTEETVKIDPVIDTTTNDVTANNPSHSKDPVEEQTTSKEQIDNKYQAPEASALPVPEFLTKRNYKRNFIITKIIEDRENNNYYDDSGNETETSH